MSHFNRIDGGMTEALEPCLLHVLLHVRSLIITDSCHVSLSIFAFFAGKIFHATISNIKKAFIEKHEDFYRIGSNDVGLYQFWKRNKFPYLINNVDST